VKEMSAAWDADASAIAAAVAAISLERVMV
jgi:hypothetical protein